MGKRMAIALVVIITLSWSPKGVVPSALAQAPLPRPDHIVIVIEENKDYGQIVGSANAPYLNLLIEQGALLDRSYALIIPASRITSNCFPATSREFLTILARLRSF